jgi:phage major head subunit gpT-like protein
MATSGTYAFLDNKNLIGMFDEMYEAQLNSMWARDIGMIVNSNMETETYGWLGGAPVLEELKGEAKTIDGLNKFTYTLRNKEYAVQMLIKELDLRRDKLSMIEKRIGDLSQKAADHWNTLAATLLTNGATSGYNSYDGTTFFSASHSESGTAQKNLVTSSELADLNVGTATAPTPDEAAKVVQALIGHFYTFTDDKGSAINGTAKSFSIYVGTVPLWSAFSTAVSANNLTSGASNPVIGLRASGVTVDVKLIPALSASTDKVYAFRNDSIVKPLILQEEVPLDPQMTDTSSDEYKKFRRFIFSLYTSRAAGYGRWQSAIRATLS